MRNSPNINRLILPFCAFLGIIAGCGLKPDKIIDPGKPPHIYPARTAPESVLVYLSKAWEQRDSLAADTIYADDYSGTSTDRTEETPSIIPFTKTDEVAAFANIAKDQSITATGMNLFPTTWQRQINTLDPPDWVTIKVVTIDIFLQKGLDNELRAHSESEFSFSMRPFVPAPGDTLWEIVRWNEKRTAI